MQQRKASGPATLNLDGDGAGPARRAGHVTKLAGGGVVAISLVVAVLLWAAGGWSLGQSIALLASLLFLAAIAFHIADHVADFLGR